MLSSSKGSRAENNLTRFLYECFLDVSYSQHLEEKIFQFVH
jgi:hypothetical protein